MSLLVLVIILLLLIGAFPAWPYSRGWGYYPAGGLGLVLIIVLTLYLLRMVEQESSCRRRRAVNKLLHGRVIACASGCSFG